MEQFVKGDIVVVPFPFSDLSDSKKRPALVINNSTDDDLILCMITTKNKKDDYVIELSDQYVENGELRVESYIRPNKIFTADESIIFYKIGNISEEKLRELDNKIIKIFNIESL
ncbi:MAG: growth inhibitor PemK [Clostridiales bacterium GWE2_32_10]|nr:MAG: growth inhibitor PemK [Clostridiales bacterium GWE2_32_10]HBY19481.1 growth inhibitor PemK [Clostridiales bacterium]